MSAATHDRYASGFATISRFLCIYKLPKYIALKRQEVPVVNSSEKH
jgi:hypothetical protein